MGQTLVRGVLLGGLFAGVLACSSQQQIGPQSSGGGISIPMPSGGSSGSSGSSRAPSADPLTSATPQQKKALAQAAESAKPVNVGGELVQPGALGLGELAGASRGVPTPLIALICLLAASALGAGGWWLWSRVLARRLG